VYFSHCRFFLKMKILPVFSQPFFLKTWKISWVFSQPFLKIELTYWIIWNWIWIHFRNFNDESILFNFMNQWNDWMNYHWSVPLQ
jgi:hypothetical protein